MAAHTPRFWGILVFMPDRVYLDWNATTPLRREAREAMADAWDLFGNPSSVHAHGRRGGGRAAAKPRLHVRWNRGQRAGADAITAPKFWTRGHALAGFRHRAP